MDACFSAGYDAPCFSSFSLLLFGCCSCKKYYWNHKFYSCPWFSGILTNDGYQKCNHAAQLLQKEVYFTADCYNHSGLFCSGSSFEYRNRR